MSNDVAIERLKFANEAFYLAFASGDYDAMLAVWARDGAISCIHPGWEPLFGHHDVMESWRAILTSPPAVACRDAVVRMQADSVGLVICYEVVRGGILVASNGFTLLQGEWRMCHHHAGATRGRPSVNSGDSEPETVN